MSCKFSFNFRISKFYMDHASSRRKLYIQPALAVEKWDCPIGYSGTSCEVAKFMV